MRWRSSAWILSIAAIALSIWWTLHGGSESAGTTDGAALPEVLVASVRRQPLAEKMEAVGTTYSWEEVEVRSTVTEIIDDIAFKDGQLVRQGDLLLTLERREEQALLVETRAVLEEQIREVRRIEELVARKSLPQNQLDERL